MIDDIEFIELKKDVSRLENLLIDVAISSNRQDSISKNDLLNSLKKYRVLK